MSKLVVFGSVNADHVVKVPSFPRPGETLHGSAYQVISGGKGANQAVAAARLGADIGFIACVGDDPFGQMTVKEFVKDGINVDAVLIEKAMPTGIAMIQVADTGENSICISAEANGQLNAERLRPYLGCIESAKYLLLQLETPMDGVELAVEKAHAAGVTIVLNPAPAKALSNALLKHISIITPNETEAELLTGVTVSDALSAQQASDVLFFKGVSVVMITLGAKGVWLSNQVGVGKMIAGFKVKACDTTAAGDTFNGALVTALIEGKSLEDAIVFANAAAAISVTRFGAQTSIPKRQEVDKFLDNNG
ncbi:ribokinase [Alginatibacterium sediminis]|uniref:Ribokinase n=1 Tax=Alginatibacterium sediminis TaxID=2164068 RepID=A0A420E6R9_9ALTE|nr:ribokinase [Alginatibacterium sediminis]RKF13657.1 ribokinase [Alginatibacterium sediminis]